MTTLLQLLSIGARSLGAAQFAQATVGNNAANASTPGYSRRQPSLTEIQPVDTTEGRVGLGVQISGLQRLRDALMDIQWRLDSQDYQYSKAQTSILNQVGALLTPADGTPLTTSLNGLFAAFGDLSARPEDSAVRQTLVVQAQAFTNAVHSVYDQVQTLESSVTGTINDRVNEINQVDSRLATVNGELSKSANDPSLLDERDRLVDRLSELIGVRTIEATDGSVRVVVDGTGIQLVDGVRTATLQASGAATSGTVTLSVDGLALAAPSGEVGGLLDVRNSSTDGLPSVLTSLDTLAAGVIAAVNRVHASGSGLTLPNSQTGSVAVTNPAATLATAGLWLTPHAGTLTLGVFDASGNLVSSSSLAIDPATMSLNDVATALGGLPNISASVSGGKLTVNATNPANRIAFGTDTSDTLVALGLNGFFTGTDARTIDVSPDLTADPNRIAAAQADFTAGVVSPGDGRNASALSALGQSAILAGNTQTAADYIGALGAAVGTVTRAASTRANTLETVLQAADTGRQAVAGVNIDEELADMVRYQHAYEASAKYVTTVDNMVQALLDMVQ